MRTKRTLLNMAYALGSSLLLLLLGLVTRRLLVDNFGPQITTASQVVSQLFNFFSIAEFGVGSVISYRLYEQIAAKNEEKISKYMSMYKWAYRVVGLVIAGLALIGAAALRWIMPDVPAATAYTVYGLNVVSTLCSYFLITRRLMYTCTQQGYRCTQIDFCCNVLTSLAKIAVSLWFPNYVLYFSVTIFFNVTANLLIARRFRKDFPYVHDVKVTVNDFKDLGIFHDLRYFLVHRLSNTIYGSSDTIVTSRLGGSTHRQHRLRQVRRRQRPRQAGVLGHGPVQLPVCQLRSYGVFLPVPAVHGVLDGRKMAAAAGLRACVLLK